MDEFLRRLERLAASGDPEALQELQRWRKKVHPTRYFCYSQNNVEGIVTTSAAEGIGPYIVMEAFDEEHADARLYTLLGANYYDYCECCGRRWGNVSLIFYHLDKLSKWWNRRVAEYPYRSTGCFVHLLDGTIVSC